MKWSVSVSVSVLLAGIFVIVSGGALAKDTSSLAESVVGVYDIAFESHYMNGEKFQTGNILEIVPYKGDSAHFRLVLHFTDGHSYDISGIADAERSALVYRHTYVESFSRCVLSIRRAADGIYISEERNDARRMATCGARGSYNAYCDRPNDRPDFFLSTRQHIRYMKTILNPYQYADAVKDYTCGKH